LCSSSDHETNSCPYYACYDQPDFLSPRDNTDVVLILPDSVFPLAQYTGLEVSEPFGFDERIDVYDACFKLEDILDEVHDLDSTPLEASRDVLMHKESPNLGFDNIALPNSLDHTNASPTCSQPSIFPEYYLDAPIDNLKICDSNVDLGFVDNMFNMLGGNVDNFLFV